MKKLPSLLPIPSSERCKLLFSNLLKRGMIKIMFSEPKEITSMVERNGYSTNQNKGWREQCQKYLVDFEYIN